MKKTAIAFALSMSLLGCQQAHNTNSESTDQMSAKQEAEKRLLTQEIPLLTLSNDRLKENVVLASAQASIDSGRYHHVLR